MKSIRVLYKLLLTTFFMMLFFVCALIINILLFPSDFIRRKILTKLSSFLAKLLLKCFGFSLKLQGTPPQNNGTLIIGNHMSYLDILIYLSYFECLFVTSVETKQRPFLGQVTMLAGCLFVERRNPRNLPNELKNIKKYFDNNLSVCFFPEGTSSNGEGILPFKRSLFQLPLEAKCPVQPILLKYTSIDGQDFGPDNCDSVCWYGDHQPFFQHLLNLLKLRKIDATIEIFPQVRPEGFKNRREIADHCYKLLSDKYS